MEEVTTGDAQLNVADAYIAQLDKAAGGSFVQADAARRLAVEEIFHPATYETYSI